MYRSRICVKNLAKYVTEDQLREHFSLKGDVTDAKLMRTKDGKSRQFAFIGFRTESEAEEAIRHFNRSFLGTSRIECEIARIHGDPNIPRPWSRHSLKKDGEVTAEENKVPGAVSSKVKGSTVDANHDKEGNDNYDLQLREFLEVMKPRAKSKLWADDSLIAAAADQSGKVGKKPSQKEKGNKEKPVALDVELKESASEKPSIINEAVVSDMDYFKSRMKKHWSDSDSDRDNDDLDGEGHGDDDVRSSPNQSPNKNNDPRVDKFSEDIDPAEVEEGIPPGGFNDKTVDTSSNFKDEDFEAGRLFIRNLSYSATEDELEEHFSQLGDTSEVHLVVDKDTKQSKGFAYVRYARAESAARALEELDKTIFQGRLLHIMPAKKKYTADNVHQDQGSKTLKQRREDQKKAAEAGGDTRAWNSLFMRSDTVAENIARRHGISKSDLLDPESDDLAVRVALGETQVIAETKKALATAGVNVKSLEEIAAGNTDGLKRSKHVVIVKNLPYGSSEGELAQMFGKFGSLDKIVLPPTKTMGLVIFLQPSDARTAFRGLAYKRYKDAPLYLEWAPADILNPRSTSKDDQPSNAAADQDDVKRVMLEQSVEGISEADIDPDRIEIKKHIKNGKNVSMGFGFLEFDSVETATNICRDLQGTVLDGHALILQLCHTNRDEHMTKKVEKDKSSTKLLVRNVAFEATEKDLRQLFSPFGQILERAKEGETLEELRERTAAQFADEQNGLGAKSKKRKNMAILDEGTMKFQRVAD
ncbi:unnamed protein product [Linum tenue]|uniref:RRM domain-containing protein n=1 Tax=Linum tenue TaxID=586396 RepID=A0AAV0NS30_9ROSI|nr:unnamed protein product [Linum tenue]